MIERYIDSSALNQRIAILNWFKTYQSLTTFEARDKLGIMHPGGRILELRRQGYWITTHWSTDYDPLGQAHRVACYVLLNRTSEYTRQPKIYCKRVIGKNIFSSSRLCNQFAKLKQPDIRGSDIKD